MLGFRSLICFTSLVVSSVALPQPAAAPFKLPFSTKGRDIIQADGSKYVFASTNWPGHQEAMVPEGLQYSSVKDIVSKIKAFGLNSVRLTYATQMIDEIYSKGSDTSLEVSFKSGLGDEYGAQILQKVLSYNPEFTANTTRLQVFDAVAKELSSQGLVLHLDNHMSSATWCCGENDGNGWFGESKFNVNNWIRGWKYIAAHVSLAVLNHLMYYALMCNNSHRQLRTGHRFPLPDYETNFAMPKYLSRTIGSHGTSA